MNDAPAPPGKTDLPPAHVDWERPWESGIIKLETVYPSPPDPRDHRFMAPAPRSLPRVTRVGRKLPALMQWSKGSCATFALLALLRNEWEKAGQPIDPSEGFFYALLLAFYGQTCQNAGAWPRDACKLLADVGTLSEDEWPYVGDTSDLCRAPTDEEKGRARFKIREYVAAQGLDGVRGMLADDYLVLAASVLYNNFVPDPANNYVIPPPDPASGSPGGHAYVIEGVDLDFDCGRYGRGCAEILNSWSPAWGMDGRARLPLAFFSASPDAGGFYRDDHWTVRPYPREDPQPEPGPNPTPDPVREFIARIRRYEGNTPIVEAELRLDASTPGWRDLEIELPGGSRRQAKPYIYVQ